MKAWFVVRTKTGCEDRVVWHLNNQKFHTYLPRYRKDVRHARKVQTVLRPVFPGYVFVQIDVERQAWRAINGTIGVIGLVQFGEKPTPLSDLVVEMIREQEDESGAVCVAKNAFHVGDRVRLRDGALSEHTALLTEVCDNKRAILLLALMGREVRVTAPLDSLAKAS